MTRIYLIFFLLCSLSSSSFPQAQQVPFDSGKWTFADAEKTEFLGRKCLMGYAYLKDVNFENGIIEFDMAVTGERSYPGVVFRMKKGGEYERIYVRPHLPKVFQNVVQYEGTFHGLDSWQLYYGSGKTAAAAIPADTWFHVKVEVKDKMARFYMNDSLNPVLIINDLAHGLSSGTLGVYGPKDGTAYFANFSYQTENNLKFSESIEKEASIGVITDWELSKPLKYIDIDPEALPEQQGMKDLKWQKIKSLPSGLVDVSRYYARLGQSPDIIWAKTIINSNKAQIKQYAFGYSDIISIFLNGKLLFTGNSAYTSRDANFQGILGLNDYISLTLEKGNNELIVALTESFGGWGFMFQDIDAVYAKPGVTKLWEIKTKFNYPESVVYDKKRKSLFVSNFTYENGGFISKVNLDGTIEKLDWITGIMQPTGVTIYNDKLFVVGRYNLIEIDIEKGAISGRYPFPAPVFANDVAADNSGNLYITDGAKGAIYKFENGKITEWLNGKEVAGVNGIIADGDKIIVGTSNDGTLKSIGSNSKAITKIISLGDGVVIDGLSKDENGDYLISDHAGRIIRITNEGKSTTLLNTTARPIQLADFEYIPEQNLLVIPTFEDNRLMLYKIK